LSIDKTFPASLSRRDFARTAALAALGAAMPSFAFAQSADPARNWPGVARLIESYVGPGKVANMVTAIGLGMADADVLAQGNTSYTSVIAVDQDTLYRIYSMTKPITGMATMQCIEEGWLELDQPIADVIPGFANMQVQKVYDGAITAASPKCRNTPAACSRDDPMPKLAPATITSPSFTPEAKSLRTASRQCQPITSRPCFMYAPGARASVSTSAPTRQTRAFWKLRLFMPEPRVRR
jgi:hypothetical protein